ncbi:glycosyltransferase family 2 protein [Mangrovimicrobium sediminis]|uniref:Glycosyltransferase family 2 protein n=1 Tax=Mangrovimicrobium sediminis TaxID=2562682 RepID=A0A4Z0M3D7_9GAMM|nr:glycosyltransferase family 2 protein [Haliea sp. SAOS-164]TGD73966.1 glycosyltransferase family 2 protein [Haliea sp. SAOS-164]
MPDTIPANSLGVAIVNYRTADLVCRCLAALAVEKSAWRDFHVVIVDNASADDSVAILEHHIAQQQWQDWVTVIAAPRNGGFSYGNNIAFRRLEALHCDYIWMLNPDTLPLPGASSALRDLLQGNACVGMAGSRLEDEDGTAQVSAFNYPTPLGELLTSSRLGLLAERFPQAVVAPPVAAQAHRSDWLAGASIMFPVSLLREVGYMDEQYFLYFEEVDYCRSVAASGREIWYCPDSRVVHMVGAATGISDERKQAPRRPRYWFDSRRRYYRKNHGLFAAVSADLLWLAGYSSWLVRRTLQRKPNNDPPYFLRDFLRFSLFGDLCDRAVRP